MSLRPYVGEYLISPVPLHFGLNVCSHGCFYCFANLNKPDRRSDNSDLLWLSKWNGDDSTLVGWFLSKGYPLLVSNDSDPLAASNEETFRALHKVCQRKDIPICYQTKGGHPEHQEILLSGRPTMIYISLTSDRPDILKMAEPGAPDFEHRMALAIEAKRRGHHVVIGVNPLVPEWWADFPEFCRRLSDAGILHAWCGAMHLSYQQIEIMPIKHRDRFQPLIESARTKRSPDAMMLMDLEEAGINVLEGSTAETAGFWDAYFALGYPFFPTLDGWFAYLEKLGEGEPVAFTLADFNRWANLGPMPDRAAFTGYLNAFGRSVRNTGESTKARSFPDVHAWYWRLLEFPTPLRHDRIYVAHAEQDGEIITLVDSGDREILVYAPGVGTGDIAWRVDHSPVVWLEE